MEQTKSWEIIEKKGKGYQNPGFDQPRSTRKP